MSPEPRTSPSIWDARVGTRASCVACLMRKGWRWTSSSSTFASVDEHRFTDAAAALARSIDGHGGVEEALAIIGRCARDRDAPRTIENAAG
jgi:hypothetical protein